MTTPLFRTEALERAKPSAYGSILLARPLSHLALTALFVTFSLALIAFFASFSYTSKARAPGILLPARGVIRVMPLQGGLVTELRVREGQAVAAGEVLFVLVSERADASRGSVEQSISASLQRRRDSLVADGGELRQQLAQRIEAARRKGADLAGERERIEQQVGLQQRLAELQRARAAVEREHAALRDESAALQIQARRDQAAGERSIGDAERELTEHEARRQLLVRAPEAGTVSAIIATVGQSVSASQALLSILPAGSELEAEIYAPSREAGFLRPGMPVTLRYQAYAYQKFGQTVGKVREVSNTAMRSDEMALPGATLLATPNAEPLYRVRVTIPRQTVKAFGREIALKSGTALEASIQLETRALYEWVLAPLYTIKGQV